jgi:hypothetical protein
MELIMQEQKRIIESYNPQTFTSVGEDLEEFTLYSIPMRLFLFDNKLKLTVEVYKKEQFENKESSKSALNREFEIDYSEAKQTFPEFFNEIESAFFDWLEVSSDVYNLQMLDINLVKLKIRTNARHKMRFARDLPDETKTADEFEEMKGKYPNLVYSYYAFARLYAAQNDEKLARFK